MLFYVKLHGNFVLLTYVITLRTLLALSWIIFSKRIRRERGEGFFSVGMLSVFLVRKGAYRRGSSLGIEGVKCPELARDDFHSPSTSFSSCFATVWSVCETHLNGLLGSVPKFVRTWTLSFRPSTGNTRPLKPSKDWSSRSRQVSFFFFFLGIALPG